MWPPTWNIPMGSVFLRMAEDGRRSFEKRMAGDMKRRQ
jgi:hypothetical protein